MHLKINIEKTSQKVTKDPRRVEAARKGRESFVNKLKENILNDAKKVGKILAMQAMKLPAPPALPAPLPPALPAPPPQDPVILMLWRWYICCPYHRRLRIFYVQQKGRTSHP